MRTAAETLNNTGDTVMVPTLFLGHGNPLNAVAHNAYTDAWAGIGKRIPRPTAVLSISAHWYGPDTAVTVNAAPRTIHDFSGFPPDLYQVQYPAPGNPGLAGRVIDLLAPLQVRADETWGLDHGTWSVLCHVFPKADIPVVQLSIDSMMPSAFHYGLGQRLAPLRKEGVLILGSGNLVHNLRAYAWGRQGVAPLDWAVRFERQARDLLAAGDHARLVAYETLGPDALMAVPSPDHYLPLLYVLGASSADEPLMFPVEGFEGGSLSMLAVQCG